uniref:Uncharacterized protein n=2 Tax=Opuntia streptacantha TaxID=393608 RepID=A0A7C9DYD0_OPUST
MGIAACSTCGQITPYVYIYSVVLCLTATGTLVLLDILFKLATNNYLLLRTTTIKYSTNDHILKQLSISKTTKSNIAYIITISEELAKVDIQDYIHQPYTKQAHNYSKSTPSTPHIDIKLIVALSSKGPYDGNSYINLWCPTSNHIFLSCLCFLKRLP